MNKLQDLEIQNLKKNLDGDLFTDISHKIMYATDASAYREIPTAVVVPKNIDDIKKIIRFSKETGIPFIPRGAGTSLAGQVVGSGIIIDMSIHFTEILELNVEEKWVVVQPGVILDQLNYYLKPFGLFFGPETSTASRCTLGGMLGNNACGLHSVIYGSTRDHTLEVNAILSDGTEALFKQLTNETFAEKCNGNTLENELYRKAKEILSNPVNQQEIRKEYPDMSLPRRNTGYAIDVLLESQPFTKEAENFNFCKLLAGSEGTLAFTTSIKLNLVDAPPKEKAVICGHFNTMDEALKANIIALKHKPGAVELMDDQILKLTEGNLLQQKNRFFLKGDPGAILIIEFARDSREEIIQIAKNLEADMREANLGTYFPVVFGQEKISRVWALRKSALGVLSNMPGDAKPVSVIEDTAVSPLRLPDYIDEFKEILKSHKLSCIFHAHVGSGEIHLRPVLNLKDKNDVERFREIASDTAKLVKRHKGSLSGEHGDGRLRGEFIPLMIGENNYRLLKKIKQTWDPDNILNPGKIIDTPRMNSHLRYESGQKTREISTIFDFSDTQGMIRSIEKCNGSGDCKNTFQTGSTLCPSYQATLEEKNTTRARANLLREFLTPSDKSDLFDQKEIYDILSECLSCKACKSECPSSVDITKLKAEFMQHYYDIHGPGLRNRLVANINTINKLGSLFPSLFNFMNSNRLTSNLIKKATGFALERQIPLLHKTTLTRWAKRNLEEKNKTLKKVIKRVYFYNDEFTNHNDTEIAIKTIELLNRLGYEVVIPKVGESGRSWLSKGFVRKAKQIANQNIRQLKDTISQDQPLIGLDPSTILCFRDEYPDLADEILKPDAERLALSAILLDEFLADEMDAGNINKDQFSREEKKIKFHGHCHQKALASTESLKKILSFPENYSVEEIGSGCCGMAGSFGFEKEHYELSSKIAELTLLPEIRKTSENTIIVASGTSCRQQINEKSGREVKHPAEVLFEALA